MVLREMILLSLAAELNADGANCNVGLTVLGLGKLDGDWIAEILENGQATGFERKQDFPKGTQGPMLQHGCYFCNDTDKQKANHTWVIRTADDGQHAVSAQGRIILVATCVKGCPDSKTWPLEWTDQTTWKLAETHQAVNATSSCCKRKVQRCDSCDRNVCSSHKSLTSCLAASTLGGCCTAAAWIDQGICKCQETPLQCDHSISNMIV